MSLAETYGISEDDESEESPALDIRTLVDDPNIAEQLDDDMLDEIGMKVVREYDLDLASREGWETKMGKAMNLAMQVSEPKTFPWPGAANVQYPLITTGSIQFAARSYPAIVDGPRVAKCRVVGYDGGVQMKTPDGQPVFVGPNGQPTTEPGMPAQGPQQPVQFEPAWKKRPGEKASRADRISQHMSWQLLDEMEEWEEGVDTLLHTIPIMGSQFKKTYYSRLLGRNVSELVDAVDLVMQYKAPWATVPRKTQHVKLYPHEITERQRSGTFLDIELMDNTGDDEDTNEAADPSDDDAPKLFLEQHRLLDLDDDGYPEPYIVTVHKDSSKTVRILARFEEEGIQENGEGEITRVSPIEYFTRFLFMPAPDGGIYGMGFGWLLHDISNSVNTVINQLLDAGTLANVGGGFIGKGLRIKSGDSQRKLGEWKHVSSSGAAIRDNLYELKMPQPSPVLFNLLGLLIDAGKEISSVKDVLTGEAPKNAPATTTMAMVEQGQKVFTAIYKRLHRSLRDELKKLYRLNRLYLEPESYFTMLDGQATRVWQGDYEDEDMDVIPVSDPALVSDMQRMSKAEYLYQLAQTEPDLDRKEALNRMLEAGKFEEREKLILEQRPPDPQMMIDMERADNDTKRAEAGAKESEGKAQLAQATAAEKMAGIELDTVKLGLEGEKVEQAGVKLTLENKKIEADRENSKEQNKNGSDKG